MRKHSHSLVQRRVVALASLALFVAACTRAKNDQSRKEQAVDKVSMRTQGASLAGRSDGFVNQPSRERVSSVEMAPTAAPVPTNASAPSPKTSSVEFGSGLLPPAGDASGAMLVRQGQASLEVHRVGDALTKVRQTAQQFGGFVANTAVVNGKDEQHSATLELRVPTAQFDALLGALGSLGKVESVTANVQDVGEEYVDLGSRAANARRMEARLVEMLATRTGKLSEALTVEQELRRVREEIERYDARLRYLERRAAVSTLSITLHEPLSLIDRPRPGPIVEALGLAWERALGVLAWCIASLGLLMPLGVLVGVGVWLFRRTRWAKPAWAWGVGDVGPER